MSEHLPRSCESTTKWCNRCCNITEHIVSDGRIGRCKNHDSSAESKKQIAARIKRETEAKNPRLF
jgi:hypothetical protein